MTAKENNLADSLSLPQQNYVEAIAELLDEHGHAHPARIAELLNVRKPSVTEAVDRLVDLGIARRSGHKVLFTEKGTQIAEELTGRHEALRKFMVDVLGMDNKRADEAACRMEHSTSQKFIKRLTAFQQFLDRESNADIAARWSKEPGNAK